MLILRSGEETELRQNAKSHIWKNGTCLRSECCCGTWKADLRMSQKCQHVHCVSLCWTSSILCNQDLSYQREGMSETCVSPLCGGPQHLMQIHLFVVYRPEQQSLSCLNAFLVDGVLFLSWLQSFGYTLAFLQCFLVVTGHSNFLKAVLKISSMKNGRKQHLQPWLSPWYNSHSDWKFASCYPAGISSCEFFKYLHFITAQLLCSVGEGSSVSVLQSTWPSLMLPFQEELWVKDWAVTQVSFALGLARCVWAVSRGPGKWSETEPSPVWENDNGIFSVS